MYEIASELVQVLDAYEPEAARLFVEDRFSQRFLGQIGGADRALEQLVQWHEQAGGLEEIEVLREDASRIDLLLRCVVTERMVRLTVQTTTEGAKIRGIGWTDEPEREAALPLPETEAERVADLKAYVEKLHRTDRFSGVALVARGDELLYLGAHGQADRGADRALDVDTRFTIASMGKMFTAVAVMQAVAEGELSLDGRLGDLLGDEWLQNDANRSATVRQCLSHSAGFRSFLTEEYLQSPARRYDSVASHAELVGHLPLAFEPGTSSAYSNTGFLMLGAVLEAVHGSDYFEHVAHSVFERAGMSRSGFFPRDEIEGNYAHSYQRQTDEHGERVWVDVSGMRPIRCSPAGGCWSTAEDLWRFSLALLEGRLLPESARDRLWTQVAGGLDGYGLGFGITPTAGGVVHGHSGGFPGVATNLDLQPDTGMIAVVLCNQDSGREEVSARIRRLFFQGR